MSTVIDHPLYENDKRRIFLVTREELARGFKIINGKRHNLVVPCGAVSVVVPDDFKDEMG